MLQINLMDFSGNTGVAMYYGFYLTSATDKYKLMYDYYAGGDVGEDQEKTFVQ